MPTAAGPSSASIRKRQQGGRREEGSWRRWRREFLVPGVSFLTSKGLFLDSPRLWSPPPTPQASLDCGSTLPLSIRPGLPCRLAKSGPSANPRRSPGGPTTETPPEKAAASYRSPKRLRRGATAARSQHTLTPRRTHPVFQIVNRKSQIRSLRPACAPE